MPGTAPAQSMTAKAVDPPGESLDSFPQLSVATANFPFPHLQDPQREALEAGASGWGARQRDQACVFHPTTQPPTLAEVQKNDPKGAPTPF